MDTSIKISNVNFTNNSEVNVTNVMSQLASVLNNNALAVIEITNMLNKLPNSYGIYINNLKDATLADYNADNETNFNP